MRTVTVADALAANPVVQALTVDDPAQVPAQFLSDLADEWDVNPYVLGLVAADRLADLDVDVGDEGARWLLVPLPYPPLPATFHWADLLIGLNLPEWDGALLCTELLWVPDDGPATPAIDVRMAQMALARGPREVHQATRVRGEDDIRVGRHAGTHLTPNTLLGLALRGPRASLVPERPVLRMLTRLVSDTGPFRWVFDDTVTDEQAAVLAAAIMEDEADLVEAWLAAGTPPMPRSWADIVPSMGELDNYVPPALDDASVRWAGGLGHLCAYMSGGDEDETRRELVRAAVLFTEPARPTLPEATALDDALSVLCRVDGGALDDEDVAMLSGTLFGWEPGAEPDAAREATWRASLGDDEGSTVSRLALRHPDARVRRWALTVALRPRGYSPEGLDEVLFTLGDVPLPLARRITKAVRSLTGAAVALADGPTEELPAPARRIAAGVSAVGF